MRRSRGFTLLELSLVLAMVMVLSTVAIPAILGSVAAMNLRMTATELSGAMGYARMKAVHDNRPYALRVITVTGRTAVYLDLNNNGALDGGEEKALLVLPHSIVFDSSGPALTLSGVQVLSLPAFSAYGKPCAMSGSTCASAPGTQFYIMMRQDRIFTTPGWIAVSVTPASRIQVWSWNGVSWS